MREEEAAFINRTAKILGFEESFLRDCLLCGAIEKELELERLAAMRAERSDLARLKKLKRICDALDIDPLAGDLILTLLEQLDEAERELADLKSLMESTECSQ